MIYTEDETYMSMTIYNIYSFLFIIVYIVCMIFICLYCMLVLAKAFKGNKSYFQTFKSLNVLTS